MYGLFLITSEFQVCICIYIPRERPRKREAHKKFRTHFHIPTHNQMWGNKVITLLRLNTHTEKEREREKDVQDKITTLQLVQGIHRFPRTHTHTHTHTCVCVLRTCVCVCAYAASRRYRHIPTLLWLFCMNVYTGLCCGVYWALLHNLQGSFAKFTGLFCAAHINEHTFPPSFLHSYPQNRYAGFFAHT